MDILVAESNGLEIKFKTWGDKNGSPVLAIHGWLDNANSFDKIAPLIHPNYFIVAIDLPGHGLSSHRSGDSSYYLWDYAVDVLNVINQFGWKKFSIIAHSLGTGVASVIAGAMPHLIDKLVCIDGLGAPFVVSEEDLVSNFKRSIMQLNMSKKTKLYGFSPPNVIQFKTKEEAIKDRVNNIIAPITTEAASILTRRSLKKIEGGYRWTYDPKIVLPECYKMTESHAREFIKGISCNTLILLGKSGLFITGKSKERLQFFKHKTVHWLNGGHHLHLESAYEQVTILINQFLETKQKQ